MPSYPSAISSETGEKEGIDQDRKEEERFHLTRSIEQADVTVSNDGTLKAFHRKIERKLADRLYF